MKYVYTVSTICKYKLVFYGIRWWIVLKAAVCRTFAYRVPFRNGYVIGMNEARNDFTLYAESWDVLSACGIKISMRSSRLSNRTANIIDVHHSTYLSSWRFLSYLASHFSIVSSIRCVAQATSTLSFSRSSSPCVFIVEKLKQTTTHFDNII